MGEYNYTYSSIIAKIILPKFTGVCSSVLFCSFLEILQFYVLNFRCMIPLIFVYGRKYTLKCVCVCFLHTAIQFFHHHFFGKRLYLIFCIMSEISAHACVGLFLAFLICLPLPQYHAVLTTESVLQIDSFSQ